MPHLRATLFFFQWHLMPCHAARQIRYFQLKHETGVATILSKNENELTFVHFNSHLFCTGHGQNQSTHANVGT